LREQRKRAAKSRQVEFVKFFTNSAVCNESICPADSKSVNPQSESYLLRIDRRGMLSEDILNGVQSAEVKTEKSEQRLRMSLPGNRLTPGRFGLILGLLIFAAFPQVLLGLQTFVVRDFGFFAYPLAYFQRECFWRGELPFWDPYNNCGAPFLAQWNTMPLYPPALIYLILPLNWSLSFFCLLHLFWAGLGMYFLGYRWTGNGLGAAIAGLVFSFNGLALNLLMWPSHIATYSWMPWVLLTVEMAWLKGGRRIIIAVACGSLQMLAGGPETILLTWLLSAAIWGIHLAQSFWSQKSREVGNPGTILRRFPMVVLLVAAIAAIQILPFLDLAAHSQREQGYADTRWSMPAWGWANFLVPMVFGQVWSMGVFFQHQQAWTSSYYLGTGALLLALLAIFLVRNPRVWLLTGSAGLSLLLAMGEQTFVYRWLHRLIPQLSLMTYPVKFVTVVAFAVPLLAAFAVSKLEIAEAKQSRMIQRRLLVQGAILLSLIVLILIWAGHSPFPGDDLSATLRNGISRAIFLIVMTGLLWILPGLSSRNSDIEQQERESSPGIFQQFAQVQRLFPVLLLIILWLDVWTHEPPQNPTVPGFVYAPNLARTKLDMKPQPALGESRAMLSPAAATKFRGFIMRDPKNNFVIKRLGYFADCNLLDDVPKVDGFFSLYPRECDELNSVLYDTTNANFPRLADFMSVSQITAPGEFFKWTARDTFLPMVTAGQMPLYFNDIDLLHAIQATNFDGRRLVLLPQETKAYVTVTHETSARVISSHFAHRQVDVEVEAAEPSIVALSQTYYHGWKAFMDGQPTRLLRANYAFQAVQVPGGRHHVRVVYQDRAFYAGAVISGLALLGCLIGWWMLRSKNSSIRSQAPEKHQAPNPNIQSNDR
jgi:hypothetical protein